ncbi:MAG: hypothetical protein A2Y25_07615 [Candidatus Melainabacteria bacterium GWF2_37_15]|nr:MAG: hypothetical protein A2Y25_07615 [Candidatus Melainabacteria bacterium GWF2_37_15]
MEQQLKLKVVINYNALIKKGETLEIEFKSDKRPLSDKDIYECVIGLANTKGGYLFIGVEDNGKITGLNKVRDQSWQTKIKAAIRNNIMPPLDVKCEYIEEGNYFVIQVPSPQKILYYSTKGVYYHRVMKIEGPETVPMLPNEQLSRLSNLGRIDISQEELSEAAFDDFDPVEFARLKNLISQISSNNPLLNLSNEELAKALGFVKTNNKGVLIPTLTGMLIVGKESSINKFIPTHEVAFQVIDENLNPKTNKFFKKSIIATIEEIYSLFEAYNKEKEINLELQRISIPDYSPFAFREALLNALIHRDYSINQSIYIRFESDHLKIISPGGFIEGITLDNFITHEPKPRNRQLAEVCQRIGLVERVGRGIDKIFIEQLRLGRCAPDYSSTDNNTVRVMLPGGESNLNFVKFVVQNKITNLYELLILSTLQEHKKIDLKTSAKLIQENQQSAKKRLSNLISKNFIKNKGKDYTLSSWVYRELNILDEYIRLSGFDGIQQETMIMQYIEEKGSITRAEVETLCNIPSKTASRRIDKLIENGKVKVVGRNRSTKYINKIKNDQQNG